MTRTAHTVAALLFVALVLGACDRPADPSSDASTPADASTASTPPPEASAEAPADADSEQPDAPGFAASGAVEYYLYDERFDRADGPEQPSFRVRTPHMEWIREGEDAEIGTARFRDAEAVIFSPDGPDTVLTAGEGLLDPDAKSASLTGGVTLERGPLRVELDDILWSDADHVARSDHPVRIADGANRIEAATFEYYPVDEIINLTGVTGTVLLEPVQESPDAGGDAEAPSEVSAETPSAPPAAPDGVAALTADPAALAGAEFQRMVIESAPVVRMVRQRFETITGGVALSLQADDPHTPPMTMSASEANFTYLRDDDMLPAEITLTGDVKLSGQIGEMVSRVARLDLGEKRFRFEGDVKGSTPDIEQFETQLLTYEPGLITLEGDVYVKHADGTVRAASGRLDAEADIMTFSGAVHLTNAEGDIRAAEAVLDNARDMMTLRGGVSGDLSEIRGFTADYIQYALGSGDADMTNLRVKRIDLGGAGAGPPADGAPEMSFSAMSIDRAPKVRVAGRRVQRITGGVAFRLTPADPTLEPLRVTASESQFDYAGEGGGSLPTAVRLAGDVEVVGPIAGMDSRIASDFAEMNPESKRFVFRGGVRGSTPDISSFSAAALTYADDMIRLDGAGPDQRVEVEHEQGVIVSDQAEMSMATRIMVFTGAVQGSMPQVRGVVADRLVYDPAAGNISLDRASIEEVRRESDQRDGEKAWLFDADDVTDWPALIRRLRSGADASRPSPEARISGLLPDAVRQALGRISPDRAPNPSTQGSILAELNALLARPDLYDAETWAGVGVPPELTDTLAAASDGASATKVARANRRLFEATFPGIIAVHDETAEQPNDEDSAG